jgi:hypothetical protein
MKTNEYDLLHNLMPCILCVFPTQPDCQVPEICVGQRQLLLNGSASPFLIQPPNLCTLFTATRYLYPKKVRTKESEGYSSQTTLCNLQSRK